MAELIKRDDSLNEGRKKLNNAIEKVDTFQDQINTIVVEGDSSVEAAQARIDADNNTYPTLKARLDAKETQTSAQLAQTEAHLAGTLVNIKSYGAVGDGIVDDTQAIKDAITASGGRIFIPPGTYLISSTINIPTHAHIRGAGVNNTRIRTSDNTFDAFNFVAGAYRCVVERFILNSPSIGTNNAGFRNLGGLIESVIDNVYVSNFFYGHKATNSCWMNIFRHIRYATCAHGYFDDGTNGSSIVNLFEHVYFDRCSVGGVYLNANKSIEFINCNFGGRKGMDDVATYAIKLGSNCFGIKMSAANIEHHIANTNDGLISIRSASQLELQSTSIFDCHGVSGDIGYAIVTKDTSRINISNCYTVNNGTNLHGIYNINDSSVVVITSDAMFADITTYSSVVPIVLNRDIKSIVDALSQAPKSYGKNTVNAGVFIRTDLGRYVEVFQVTLQGSPGVTASIGEMTSGGNVKLVFTNHDGTNNTSDHIVHWVAW